MFRRHVRGCAGDDVAVCRVLAGHGEAEVGDARLAAAVDHDVGRLEIAMQDPFRVRGGEAGGKSARDLDGLVMREPADALEQARKVFAVDLLHGHEMRAVPFADVVDAADVGMRDLPPEADFLVEQIELREIVRERGGEELQRHLLAEFHIVAR
ncbi:MAG TPA: hypothetical protein VGQ46_19945 [Thermoanaerobaculia bacterium]|nr:hypothetical protein [Thermoanaerobaculia bacterium]